MSKKTIVLTLEVNMDLMEGEDIIEHFSSGWSEGIKVLSCNEKIPSLKNEFEFFNQHRMEWCNDPNCNGKYVVIKGTTISFKPTWVEAYKAGVEIFGVGASFLVKKVQEKDEVFVIY